MEVCFLDVGQGSSQIVLLGSQRAIVVDAGPSSGSVLLGALDLYRIEYVEHFVVSHNHADHVGGAVDLLTEFRGRIGTIWFLQDDAFFDTPFWARIKQQLDDGELDHSQIRRVERDSTPRAMFVNSEKAQALSIYSPSAFQNLTAQVAGTANATSGIFLLEFGSSRVVFAGDSEISQWQSIVADIKGPLECDVLGVPHHGGKMQSNIANTEQWLYGEAVRPKVAILSVGTSNQHKHPRREVVEALRAAGCKVMCTQITQRCCSNLEGLRPAVLRPLPLIGRSLPTLDRTRAGNSRNLACAGTVLIEVQADKVNVERSQAHTVAVARLSALSGANPLCVAS